MPGGECVGFLPSYTVLSVLDMGMLLVEMPLFVGITIVEEKERAAILKIAALVTYMV